MFSELHWSQCNPGSLFLSNLSNIVLVFINICQRGGILRKSFRIGGGDKGRIDVSPMFST